MKRKKLVSKRVITYLCAALLIVGSLCGCAEKTANVDGRTVITIGDFPSQETNPKAYEMYIGMIAEFEKANPNIKIKTDTWTFTPDSYLSKAEGGTLPTTYYVPLTEGRSIMELGYAADVTDEFKKRGYYDNINEFMLENISNFGKIYFLPTSCYDVGLAMNVDLLAQAGYMEEDGTPYEPQTWEELGEMAVKIKEVTGKNGFVLPTTENCGGWRFTPIAWSWGVDFMEKDENGKWQATFDTPQCAAALQFIKDLKWKYDVLPANTLVSLTEVEKEMGTGASAMTLAEPSNIDPFSKYGMMPDNIAIVRIPAGPERRVSLMGGGYSVFNRDATPEQISAVFDWLEFRGFSPKTSDELIKTLENEVEVNKENNYIVGVKSLSIWKSESDVEKYKTELYEKETNINMNHVKLYNEKSGVEYQSEEPVEAQALYAVLDGCVQEVFTNKDADCAELIHKAAANFQKNQLDYVK